MDLGELKAAQARLAVGGRFKDKIQHRQWAVPYGRRRFASLQRFVGFPIRSGDLSRRLGTDQRLGGRQDGGKNPENPRVSLAQQEHLALELPYQGEGFSMILLLPKKADGFEAFEKALDSDLLESTFQDLDRPLKPGDLKRPLKPGTVEVYVPRFTFAGGIDLIPAFKELGMRKAFVAGQADFRGMGWPKGDLWIAQIRHKTLIEVNEEGMGAAGFELDLKGAVKRS